ncbi:MAG: type I-E CRISPR-associated protein Cas6/Cse3/CasE [bacterium]
MYISHLLIDVGNNPDRPRPGRLWLRNLYHVHQRLCMAFPSDPRLKDDPEFLKPFNPEDFGNGHVCVTREPDTGFLFRVDPLSGGRVMLLVQSAIWPKWDYAFQNVPFLSACEVKPFDAAFENGQRLRFRLVANPTRKICTKTGADGRRRHGKRVPVPTDQLFDWLARKAKESGFSINTGSTTIQPGYVYANRKPDSKGQRLRSVLYEGILTVAIADKFNSTLIQGVGPGKAFGFGLLSVAPVHS